MGPTFRFSSRPNRAAEVGWRHWGKEAFGEAHSADKPILLCLTAIWCHWCHQMDETTYSDPLIIEFVNQHFIPIRVDADQYPHVHDRYVAGGWPTNAFLTTTGEVLWAGTYIPADKFLAVAEGVRSAWSERRAELGAEIERRRKALEAARARVTAVGIVRRDAADDVWTSILESFDARNGGFGGAPKYPATDAVELLFLRGTAEGGNAITAATQTLDGMLAGELWDAEEYGFFRYAEGADWTEPQYEKLLSVNAALLRGYAEGARILRRADWLATAERTVAYVNHRLRLPGGLWAASQAAAPDYYASGGTARRALEPPPIDATIYTSTNAQWIRALADAGARLDRPDWVVDAERGLQLLVERMRAPNQLFYHYQEVEGAAGTAHLLVDPLEVARACVSLAQATGKVTYLQLSQQLVNLIEQSYWADDGGFYDRSRSEHDVGVLRYRDRPFDLNADMARLLIDLTLALGERSYRALAERTLAILSPLASRYAVAGANFALAVHEFFDAPVQVFVVGSGDQVSALRAAALDLTAPSLRVWPLPQGGRIGTQSFPPQPTAAYIVGPHGISAPVTQPGGFAAALRNVS